MGYIGCKSSTWCMHGTSTSPMNKSFTLQCVVSLLLNNSHFDEPKAVRARQWHLLSVGTVDELVPPPLWAIIHPDYVVIQYE